MVKLNQNFGSFNS